MRAVVPSPGALSRPMEPPWSDTIFFVHCGSISEPLDTLRDLHSKNAPAVDTACPNIIACTRYTNPEYDKLMDQASVTSDAKKRAEVMQQAETILLKELPVLPIYFYVSKNLVSTKVKGWEWLLVGKDGTGIGYVSISMLSPEDKYVR